MLEVAVPARQRLGVAARGLGRERGRDLLHLTLETPDVLEAPESLGEHRSPVASAGHLLREIADRRPAGAGHASAIRLLDSREDAAERGLAAPLGPTRPMRSPPPIRHPDVAKPRFRRTLGDLLKLIIVRDGGPSYWPRAAPRARSTRATPGALLEIP